MNDPRIDSWLSKKTSKYTSHVIQNEILKAMYLNVIRNVASKIQESGFFCIMCNECCDVSNKEQLVVHIRWVDSRLQAHEEFIGMYTVSDIKSDTIVAAIRDRHTRLNISLQKCRGQSYDGASNMTGRKRGVLRQICEKEPKALFLHCYGYALNLAVSDTVKGCEVVKDSLDIAFEVSKLISFHQNVLHNLKS